MYGYCYIFLFRKTYIQENLHTECMHFNNDNPLSNIFNGNTVKICYSWTNNMFKILNNHSRKLLDELNRNNERTDRVPWNCRKKDECLLDGQCNLKNVVYQAFISSMEHNNDVERIYICYILTFDPAPKMLFLGDTSEGSDTFQWPVIERDRVGGLRLMIWDKVKVSLCHYTHAPEESNLWTAWQLFPLDDD